MQDTLTVMQTFLSVVFKYEEKSMLLLMIYINKKEN